MTDIKVAYATGTKSSGVAPVRLGAQNVNAQCPQDLTVASGDPVLVAHVGALWFIVARYFSTGVAPAPLFPPDEPPVAPASYHGETTFLPIQTASYRAVDAFPAGWRTDSDRLYQGELGTNGSHTGCAFYGTQPISLAGKTVTAAWVKARRPASGGSSSAQTVTMGRITESSQPVGAPTFTNSFTGPSLAWGDTTTQFIIPTAAAQALVNGTSGGLGIHVATTPYVVLDGLSDYAGAFALTIQWTT